MAFWQLTLPVSPEIADALTNFLWEQGALGVVEEEMPPAPPSLRAFFADTASSTGLARAVADYQASLRSLGFAVAPVVPDVTPLHDGEWASAWQQSFPPIEVGERLLVVPPWEARDEQPRSGRIQVVIEPGRAFGTGHHGSTEGCLVLLEQSLASPGATPTPVLDIGTGTGILAVAAVKLGAPAVLALDTDPDAVAAAGLNAERNGCRDRIALEMQDAKDIAGAPFPLVVANLLTHTHLALRSHYERLTALGGSLILGGMLAEEDAQVVAALETSGFALTARITLEGWASLRFRAPASRR
jgi:ribosomal protein L11 methyltransferase